ncbi:MAG: hypothetical protein RXP91_03120 [Nitrososphaeria archaeon]
MSLRSASSSPPAPAISMMTGLPIASPWRGVSDELTECSSMLSGSAGTTVIRQHTRYPRSTSLT